MKNVLIRLFKSPIIVGICFFMNLFNFYFLLVASVLLYYNITMDVEAYVSKHHIHPGTGAIMFLGVGLGPILSLTLSIITCFIMSRRSIKGKIIIFSISLLFLILLLLLIKY